MPVVSAGFGHQPPATARRGGLRGPHCGVARGKAQGAQSPRPRQLPPPAGAAAGPDWGACTGVTGAGGRCGERRCGGNPGLTGPGGARPRSPRAAPPLPEAPPPEAPPRSGPSRRLLPQPAQELRREVGDDDIGPCGESGRWSRPAGGRTHGDTRGRGRGLGSAGPAGRPPHLRA